MKPLDEPTLSFDIPGIQACQCNRHPMLFIDRITECVPLKYAKGYKLFSAGEWYFSGHFEGNPVVPGTVLVESLSQVFLMTFLSVGEAKGSPTASNNFQNIKFHRKIVPGDKLDIEATCGSFRRGVAKGKAAGYVGGELAASLEATIVVPKLFSAFQRGGAGPKALQAPEAVPGPGLCLNAQGIKKCMKNRSPWLYLDKAVDVKPMQSATGVKNFTYNEWFFPPHFPGDPSVPGFIQMETALQAFLMTFLSSPEYQGLETADHAMSNVKLPRKIVPGEILRVDAVLDSFKRGVAKGRVSGSVNGEPSISFEVVAVVLRELEKYNPNAKGPGE